MVRHFCYFVQNNRIVNGICRACSPRKWSVVLLRQYWEIREKREFYFSLIWCLGAASLIWMFQLFSIKAINSIMDVGSILIGSVIDFIFLKDFIESQLKVIELDEIYRQSKDSGIVQLAHQLIHQEVNDLSLFEQYKDIHFYNSTNFEIIKNVTTIVKKAIENGYDQNDIQVLAPIYQGVAGINALNLALQEIFNPKNHQEEYRIGQKVYREGDKILQLKNRPDDDIYNGDIGVLVEINRKDGFEYLEDTLIVDYDGNLVEYTSKDFMTFTLAYCMSIHKAQGNEFKIVIMPVLNDYYIMLKRNLIYTGLTRAKQALFILGNPQAFLYGIKNISDSKRKTTLVSKINQNKNIETYEESSYNQELKQNITDFLNDDETV